MSLNFNTIPQRFNITLSLALVVSGTNTVKTLAENPPNDIVLRSLYLAMMVLWGLKVFIDDHLHLKEGKSHPGVDILFMVGAFGTLICAVALVGLTSNIFLKFMMLHFLLLIIWLMIPIIMNLAKGKRNKRLFWFWLAADIAALLVLFYQPNSLTYVTIALLMAIMIFDTLLSGTLKKEKLVGG